MSVWIGVSVFRSASRSRSLSLSWPCPHLSIGVCLGLHRLHFLDKYVTAPAHSLPRSPAQRGSATASALCGAMRSKRGTRVKSQSKNNPTSFDIVTMELLLVCVIFMDSLLYGCDEKSNTELLFAPQLLNPR